MSNRSLRWCAGILGLSAAYVGLWAALAPESFFETFPLSGHPWVSAVGPFDEHLVRDVGGLYLALLVVTAWGVVRPRRETFRVVGIAWLVFGVPHLVFHLDHLDGFGAVDRIGNAVALGATIALATVLVVGSHGGDDAVTAPVPGRADGGGS